MTSYFNGAGDEDMESELIVNADGTQMAREEWAVAQAAFTDRTDRSMKFEQFLRSAEWAGVEETQIAAPAASASASDEMFGSLMEAYGGKAPIAASRRTETTAAVSRRNESIEEMVNPRQAGQRRASPSSAAAAVAVSAKQTTPAAVSVEETQAPRRISSPYYRAARAAAAEAVEEDQEVVVPRSQKTVAASRKQQQSIRETLESEELLVDQDAVDQDQDADQDQDQDVVDADQDEDQVVMVAAPKRTVAAVKVTPAARSARVQATVALEDDEADYEAPAPQRQQQQVVRRGTTAAVRPQPAAAAASVAAAKPRAAAAAVAAVQAKKPIVVAAAAAVKKPVLMEEDADQDFSNDDLDNEDIVVPVQAPVRTTFTRQTISAPRAAAAVTKQIPPVGVAVVVAKKQPAPAPQAVIAASRRIAAPSAAVPTGNAKAKVAAAVDARDEELVQALVAMGTRVHSTVEERSCESIAAAAEPFGQQLRVAVGNKPTLLHAMLIATVRGAGAQEKVRGNVERMITLATPNEDTVIGQNRQLSKEDRALVSRVADSLLAYDAQPQKLQAFDWAPHASKMNQYLTSVAALTAASPQQEMTKANFQTLEGIRAAIKKSVKSISN